MDMGWIHRKHRNKRHNKRHNKNRRRRHHNG